MNPTCSVALKEWAVVQHALLAGKQIMLLRKGGLIEETGQFELKSRQFLIQPTYIHVNERIGDIHPQYQDWLNEEEARKTSDGVIRFEALCEAVACLKVKHHDALLKLNYQHIWSESYINMRLNWEPYKPLFAILVRAYKLAEPITVIAHPEYFGCKSWIDLREPVSTEGAIPIIMDDHEFQTRVDQTIQALRGN